MGRPVLFAVDDDRDGLVRLAYDLRRRYGADYRVVTAVSGSAALVRLARLQEEGEQVALLVAGQWLPQMTGIDFLRRAHLSHPAARRLLLFPYGDARALNAIAGHGDQRSGLLLGQAVAAPRTDAVSAGLGAAGRLGQGERSGVRGGPGGRAPMHGLTRYATYCTATGFASGSMPTTLSRAERFWRRRGTGRDGSCCCSTPATSWSIRPTPTSRRCSARPRNREERAATWRSVAVGGDTPPVRRRVADRRQAAGAPAGPLVRHRERRAVSTVRAPGSSSPAPDRCRLVRILARSRGGRIAAEAPGRDLLPVSFPGPPSE